MNNAPATLAIAALSFIAGVVADSVQPVLTFVGGGAATGAAVMCAWAARHAEPDYASATGQGTVAGAVIGAILLLADQLVGT